MASTSSEHSGRADPGLSQGAPQAAGGCLHSAPHRATQAWACQKAAWWRLHPVEADFELKCSLLRYVPPQMLSSLVLRMLMLDDAQPHLT